MQDVGLPCVRFSPVILSLLTQKFLTERVFFYCRYVWDLAILVPEDFAYFNSKRQTKPVSVWNT